ncbi:ABC transporter transmembrane domain-containing protein, partial [Gordonia aichiensis]
RQLPSWWPPRGHRAPLILAHRESTLAQADRVIRLPAPLGAALPTAPAPTTNRPDGGRPRSMAAAATDLSETPELRAAVDALPPATEHPGLPGDLRAPQPDFGLRALLRPVRGLVCAVMLLLTVDALIGVAFPPLVRYAIDTGVTAGDGTALAIAGVVGIGLVLTGLIVGAAVTVLTARTGERVLFGLRVRSYAHLQRLGLDYYERELSGRIMTRMTTDVDALSTFLQTGVATGLVGLITLVGVAVGLVLIDAGLALIVLATVPPMLLATLAFRRVSSSAYTVSRERVSVAALPAIGAGVTSGRAVRRVGVVRPVADLPRIAVPASEIHVVARGIRVVERGATVVRGRAIPAAVANGRRVSAVVRSHTRLELADAAGVPAAFTSSGRVW